MAFSANVTLEVRATGSDTNGGGFLPGSSGTDWSVFDTPQYSVTDGVAAGTTTLTSATAAFGTDVVGNLIYAAGGTGSITGNWYQIISRTNSTTIVVDRSTGLTSGTGVTLKIGGALATPGTASKAINDSGSNSSSRLVVFVKYSASPYSITTATTNTAGGCVSGQDSHSWVGYDTNRVQFAPPTQNRPTLQLNVATATVFGNLNSQYMVQNFIIDGNSQTASKCMEWSGTAYNVKVMNATTHGMKNNSAAGKAIWCEATGCDLPFRVMAYLFCVAHDNNLVGPTLNGAFQPTAGMGTAYGCIAYNNNCVGFLGFDFLTCCVSYGNGKDGFNASNTNNFVWVNCIAENNTLFGFSTNTGSIALINCASYNNVSGRYGTTSGGKLNADTNPLNATGSLFNNAASFDFSLNNTLGAGASCRALGFPTLAFPGTATLDFGDIGFQHREGAMASTKVRTPIWSSQTLTAGAGNTTSSVIDLSGGYGAQVDIVLTNGATGPTIAAQVQIQVANDYNAGSPTMWTNFGGPLVGTSTNSDVAQWSVTIPPTSSAMRLVAGSNTAQNVTVSADLSNVTAI